MPRQVIQEAEHEMPMISRPSKAPPHRFRSFSFGLLSGFALWLGVLYAIAFYVQHTIHELGL